MSLSKAIQSTRSRWAREAELNFLARLKQGIKMHRELWANGKWMVGHEAALPNQFVPLERAIELYRTRQIYV